MIPPRPQEEAKVTAQTAVNPPSPSLSWWQRLWIPRRRRTQMIRRVLGPWMLGLILPLILIWSSCLQRWQLQLQMSLQKSLLLLCQRTHVNMWETLTLLGADNPIYHFRNNSSL